MIIKTYKQSIKGVIGIIYVFGEDKFKIGSEGSSYEFPTENLDAFIKALKTVKRYSKKNKNIKKEFQRILDEEKNEEIRGS